MSSLHQLKNAEGAKTEAFRKGRGRGSGNGKTAGKGMKGQGAHSHTKKNGYEGGQTPIARRLPKFGVRKTHKGRKTVYATVNLSTLNRFKDGETVTETLLVEKEIVKVLHDGVKVLGNGKLEKKVNVEVSAISESAKKAIEEKGGSVKVIE
ncbi:MAG: 50S ribosomal protein L15 [Bacilli bacterium]|nr:50S ribosomal protein L15 [Bacilli bacterium]